MTDIELRAEALIIREAHDPAVQANGYDRCEHCHYTRHPCDAWWAANELIQVIDRLPDAAHYDFDPTSMWW